MGWPTIHGNYSIMFKSCSKVHRLHQLSLVSAPVGGLSPLLISSSLGSKRSHGKSPCFSWVNHHESSSSMGHCPIAMWNSQGVTEIRPLSRWFPLLNTIPVTSAKVANHQRNPGSMCTWLFISNIVGDQNNKLNQECTTKSLFEIPRLPKILLLSPHQMLGWPEIPLSHLIQRVDWLVVSLFRVPITSNKS